MFNQHVKKTTRFTPLRSLVLNTQNAEPRYVKITSIVALHFSEEVLATNNIRRLNCQKIALSPQALTLKNFLRDCPSFFEKENQNQGQPLLLLLFSLMTVHFLQLQYSFTLLYFSVVFFPKGKCTGNFLALGTFF